MPVLQGAQQEDAAAPKKAKKTKEATPIANAENANAADEVPTATATPIANNAANAADEVPTATATPIANAAAVPTATATPIPHASIVEDLVESDTEEEVRDHCTGVS